MVASVAARTFLLDDDSRDEMFDLIKEHGLEEMAEEVSISPVTLSKAVSGHGVGGNTILAIREYLSGEESDETEDRISRPLDDFSEDTEEDDESEED